MASPPARAWGRYAWAAGIVFVVAVVTESALSFGIPLNQDDSATKIATGLHQHRRRILLIASLCTVYAVAFPVYLSTLHELLRATGARARILTTLVLVGGVLMVTLHAVSDVAIYFLLAGKLASYGAAHDPGLSYLLYLLTFALDSVGDVFGSLFLVSAGLLVLRDAAFPRWLGWLAVIAGALLFLQAFGLGGVVATFGLVLDGIGFVLFLLFVLVTGVIGLTRDPARPAPA